MASFQVADGYQGTTASFDFSVLFYGTVALATKKRYVLDFGDGFVDFRGTKFEYSKAGMPKDGAVEGYAIVIEGTRAISFGGYDVTVKEFVKAASTISTTDDMKLAAKMLSGKDTLTGNSQTDHLSGYGGKDTIYGAGGADLLSGGAGKDKFIYLDASDSTLDVMDVITDFQHGDRISVSAIADFTFIGDEAFSGGSAQLGYVVLDGDTFVIADVDGDETPDFSVQIEGTFTLTASDFIL